MGRPLSFPFSLFSMGRFSFLFSFRCSLLFCFLFVVIFPRDSCGLEEEVNPRVSLLYSAAFLFLPPLVFSSLPRSALSVDFLASLPYRSSLLFFVSAKTNPLFMNYLRHFHFPFKTFLFCFSPTTFLLLPFLSSYSFPAWFSCFLFLPLYITLLFLLDHFFSLFSSYFCFVALPLFYTYIFYLCLYEDVCFLPFNTSPSR